MASAYFRYVSTDAITTRASTESSSMPTNDTLTQASITMPLSRIRSTTSAKLDESVDLFTFAMICSPFRLSSAGDGPHVMFDLPSYCKRGTKHANIRFPQYFQIHLRYLTFPPEAPEIG